jgi:hypothetical protein
MLLPVVEKMILGLTREDWIWDELISIRAEYRQTLGMTADRKLENMGEKP